MEIEIGKTYRVIHFTKGEFDLKIIQFCDTWIEGIIPGETESIWLAKLITLITPIEESTKIDPSNRIKSALLEDDESAWCVDQNDGIGVAQLLDHDADVMMEIPLSDLNDNETDSLIKQQMMFVADDSISIQAVLDDPKLEWDGEYLDEEVFRDTKIKLAIYELQLAKLGKLEETFHAIENFKRKMKWV